MSRERASSKDGACSDLSTGSLPFASYVVNGTASFGGSFESRQSDHEDVSSLSNGQSYPRVLHRRLLVEWRCTWTDERVRRVSAPCRSIVGDFWARMSDSMELTNDHGFVSSFLLVDSLLRDWAYLQPNGDDRQRGNEIDLTAGT